MASSTRVFLSLAASRRRVGDADPRQSPEDPEGKRQGLAAPSERHDSRGRVVPLERPARSESVLYGAEIRT